MKKLLAVALLAVAAVACGGTGGGPTIDNAAEACIGPQADGTYIYSFFIRRHDYGTAREVVPGLSYSQCMSIVNYDGRD